MTGSNRRPPRCKRGALPAELIAPAPAHRAVAVTFTWKNRAGVQPGVIFDGFACAIPHPWDERLRKRGYRNSPAERSPGRRTTLRRPGHPSETLVHGVFQSLARFELGLLGCRDVDRLAGARIAPLGSRAICNCKRPETNKADLGPPLQRTGNSVDHGINRLCGIGFRQPGGVCNMSDEILFIHFKPPFLDSGDRTFRKHNRTVLTRLRTGGWAVFAVVKQ